jgi:hypothetical protein
MDAKAFSEWGWRIPFLISLILLVFSVWIRLKLNETPIFQKMKEEGKGSKRPLTESFFHYPNNKYVLLALLGATAGQGVVWYTGQFYALFFLTLILKVDPLTAYIMIGISLLIGTPFFIVFGWLSDRIGRLKIILGGCLIAALTYYWVLFPALTHFVNPDLEKFQQTNQLTVTVDPATCQLSAPWNIPTPCDSARDILTKAGLSFTTTNGAAKSLPTLAINGPGGTKTIDSAAAPNWATANAPKWLAALTQAGYPPKADPAKFNWIMIELILVIMVIYVTAVYGPIAAFLVELFPTKIRYTSMSLPYHIGNGWFGGMLPLVATALVAASGNIYYGLWYPIGVAIMTFIIGSIFLTETKDTDIVVGSGISVQGKGAM